ncbi:RNA-binding protein 12B-A-like [Pelodytes ibericus]
MAVVIRLQGLPVIAGSADIRYFFSGLHIPDGGVHIIGGKFGEAFIIFASDEDARRAMSRTGGVIKDSHIQLFLSSKTEMQNTLEMNRKRGRDTKHAGASPVEDLSKILSAMKKGINQKKFGGNNPDSNFHSSGDLRTEKVYKPSGEKKSANEPKEDDSIYVFLYGLPYSASADDIINFFGGLHLVEMIFLKRSNGTRNGNALIKFGNVSDANAALKHNNEYMGHRFISIKKTTEEKWLEGSGQIEYLDMLPQYMDKHSGGLKNKSHSRSPKTRLRTRSRSPHQQQFYIHLKNVCLSVNKQDVKLFLGDPDMADMQIKFLIDKHNRVKEGFVMLENERQFEKCLGLHKCHLNGRPVFITSILRKSMLELIDIHERQSQPKRGSLQDERSSKRNLKDRPSLKRYLYLRNFPFDVSKEEVLKFFVGFSLHEDDIILLFDNKGVGLGEALVTFPSQEQASMAECLNRQHFLGTEVLLRRISEEQMKAFGAFPNPRELRHSPVYRDEYVEPLNSYKRSPRSFELSGENRSYEPLDHSLGLPELGHSRAAFRESPGRLTPYPLDIHGDDEPFRKRKQIIDYSDPRQFENLNPADLSDGALINMKNVPFTATAEEILDFFYGYNVIPESICIGYTKNGNPTGTATVCIRNYNEAMAAVNELDERPIGPRKVSLTLNRK